MRDEIFVIIVGASPIFELRGAIPLAMAQFGFPIYKAFFLSVFGNMLPVIPGLFFLRKFSDMLMHKWYFFNRLMNWLFERFQKNHKNHFESWRWSFLALLIFVAVPFPLTGAWSGMIASHLLGMSFKKSVLAIFLGIICSGIVVSGLIYMGEMGIKFIF